MSRVRDPAHALAAGTMAAPAKTPRPFAMHTIETFLRDSGLPMVEARALAARALGLTPAQLIARGADALADAAAEPLARLLARRKAGEPVAYLTGEREFYGLPFAVTPAVLIPRPETELLVDFALEVLPADVPADVLDLGTGSGCVAIAIAHARPRARVIAVDRSEAALAVARMNARRLSIANVSFVRSAWFDALGAARHELVVGNPPYVATGDRHLAEGDLRFEPSDALVAGADGLDALRTIAAAAPSHLASGGWLALEHGYDQGGRCRDLFARAGLAEVFTRRDLTGHERLTGGRLP